MKSERQRSSKKHRHKKYKRTKSQSNDSQQQKYESQRKRVHKSRKNSFSSSRSQSNDRQRRQHRKHQHRHSKNSHRYHDRSRKEKRRYQSESQLRKSQNLKSQQKLQAKAKEQVQQDKIEKQLPCFQPSGILLEFYNSRQGVKLKFTEPQDATTPVQQWRIYPFKGQQTFNPILLKQSCYLVGKDERICDILCENPSISRQHAVIQFRLIHKMDVSGNYSQFVYPYVMDLESTNGTFINDQKIEPTRYVQLLDRDILKFGLSERQYVIVKQENQQLQEEN